MNPFVVLYHFCDFAVYSLSLLKFMRFYSSRKDCFQKFQCLALLLLLILFVIHIEHLPGYFLGEQYLECRDFKSCM